jgi:hypothetical protein
MWKWNNYNKSLFLVSAQLKKDLIRLANQIFFCFSVCFARLRAGTFASSTCSPEGERYRDRTRLAKHTLNPAPQDSTCHFTARKFFLVHTSKKLPL